MTVISRVVAIKGIYMIELAVLLENIHPCRSVLVKIEYNLKSLTWFGKFDEAGLFFDLYKPLVHSFKIV